MPVATKKKKMTLKDEAHHNYTPKERELFSYLSEKERRTSSMLADKCYSGQLFARNNVVNRMKTLSEKVRQNEEPFRIMISEARGPRPIEYWIEKA